MQGQMRQDGFRSRSSSIGSDATQASRSSGLNPIPSVSPPPAYVTSAAATEKTTEKLILTPKLKLRMIDEVDEDQTSAYEWDGALFSSAALAMVNAFLDQLLYSFLGRARSTTLAALRPAVEQVLKGKLARYAIATAEGELEELLAGGEDEDELAMIEEEREGQAKFDLITAWKRSRLRVMVYIGLGEMEEEDEERHVDELISRAEDVNLVINEDTGLVSWGAAIFLTASLEYVAEQCLLIAAQAAYDRAALKRSAKSLSPEELQTEALDERVIVGEHDVERTALNSTLGRLWRTWRKTLRTPRIARTFTPPVTPSSPATPLHAKSFSSALPSRVSPHQNARFGSWPQQTGSASKQLPIKEAVKTAAEAHDDDIPPVPQVRPDAQDMGQSTPQALAATRRRSLETARFLSTGPETPTSFLNPTSREHMTSTLIRTRSSSLPTPHRSPLTMPPYQDAPEASAVEHEAVATDVPDATAETEEVEETAAEGDEVVAGEGVDLSSLNADYIGAPTEDGAEERAAGQEALKSSLLAPAVQGEEDAREIEESQAAASSTRVQPTPDKDVVAEEQLSQETTNEQIESAKTSIEVDEATKQVPPLVYVDSNDPSKNVLGSTPRQPRQVIVEEAEPVYVQRPPRQRGPNGSMSSGTTDTVPRERQKGPTGMATFYTEDRASVRRVSESSNGKRSKSAMTQRSTSFDKKQQVRSSDDTGESWHTATARSEALRKDFADLVQGDETMKYTLTPQNLVEIEQRDSPQMRQDAAAQAEMEREMEIALQWQAQGISDLPANPLTANAVPGTPSSTIDSLAGSVPDSPQSREARGPVPRPPRSNPRPSKTGLLARDARIQTESTRDLADLIRSTAPSSTQTTQQTLASGPSARSGEPVAAGRTPPVVPKILSRKPSVNTSGGSTGAKPASGATTPTPVMHAARNRAPPKAALQPRDPLVTSSNTADLIAFFKQGPPGAQVGEPGAGAAATRSSRAADSITVASSLGNYANSTTSQSVPGSVNSYSGLIAPNNAPPPPAMKPFAQQPAPGAAGPPARKQRRIKDPYAIDFSDDEDELTVLPGRPAGAAQPHEESLIDFLNNVPPPGQTETHLAPRANGAQFNTGWRPAAQASSSPSTSVAAARPVVAEPPAGAYAGARFTDRKDAAPAPPGGMRGFFKKIGTNA